MSRGGTFKDRLEYLGLSSVLGVLGALPVDGARRAGMGIASFMTRVVPLRKERALKNIAMAFPEMTEAECLKVYLGMMRNLGRLLGDFAHLRTYTPEEVLENCPLEGSEHMIRLHQAGKGGVLLTGHYGNWELLGASATAVKVPVVFLGARQRNPYVESLFNSYREGMGAIGLSLGDGLRPLIQHLKAGRILATLADQDGGRDGMFIDFLGTPASVRGGVFRIMARLGVPMITGFSWWDGGGWRARIDAPVDPKDLNGDVDTKAFALASIYTQRLEEQIRARPDHWFWVHHRWRSRPPDSAESN